MAKTYKISLWQPTKSAGSDQAMGWTIEDASTRSVQDKSDLSCGYSGFYSGNPYLIPAADWPTVQDPKRRSLPTGPRGKLAARCIVLSFTDAEAFCEVEVEGAWLRVAFDAIPLRRRKLQPGMRFLWWMAEDGIVLPEDIDPDVPQTPMLSAADEAAHRQLWDDFQQRLKSDEVWEEYTGDGL